jgi:phytoene dehydrogenase-like protein
MTNTYDAVVVGSGPNGFAAAITMAQKGYSVALFEAKETLGGGMRSAELTLPGFIHDVCSAIHPLGLGSPFFKSLSLEHFGLNWIQPPLPLAHPFDNNTAAVLHRNLASTAAGLGLDSQSYLDLMTPFVANFDQLLPEILAPLHFPKHPVLMAQFAIKALRPAIKLARSQFSGASAQALFAGLAAHSILPLEDYATAAFGLVLGVLGHTVGWPLPQGGSQSIANALEKCFISLGGAIFTGVEIDSLEALPSAKAIFLDVTPQQLLQICGTKLPSCYRHRLERYHYGPGVFKIDWALNHPIPWSAEECKKAGTVHLGGTLEEIAAAEKKVALGQIPEDPFVLIAQQSLWDASRAPPGKQTAWGYCHVPNGSTVDMTASIEAQIERFAPGFGDCIIARHTLNTQQLEEYNPNYIGGDINGGSQDITQLFTRPVARLNPYSTPLKGVYICSSSTPPGGGVHGMCGYHAAQAALKTCFK